MEIQGHMIETTGKLKQVSALDFVCYRVTISINLPKLTLFVFGKSRVSFSDC